MKDDFINQLQKGEELLFYRTSNVNKVSNQYGRLLLLLALMVLFWSILIYGIEGDELLYLICIVSPFAIFTIYIIYALFYNCVLFKIKNKGEEYFVTNKRIAVYNPKKGYKIQEILDIEQIYLLRRKDIYGMLIFYFEGESIRERINKMIKFVGIENPIEIMKAIKEINDYVILDDDRPTVMGRKVGKL